MARVYILKTERGYYVGSTVDLVRRVRQHHQGVTPSMLRMGEPELVFSQEYNTLGEARMTERRLKDLKRKDYIERIIKDGVIKMKL